MAQQTYRVEGVVIHRATREPIAGVRVEAWDNDGLCDDLLGSALTGAAGSFAIVFDASYFREGPFDKRPDVYFRVFAGGRVVADTRESVICNLAEDRTGITIEVELVVHEPPPRIEPETLVALHVRASDPVAALPAELVAALRTLALEALRRELGGAFALAPASVRDHVKQVDLVPLQGGGTVRELLRTSFEGADESVRGAGLALLDDLAMPDTLDDVLQPQRSLRENPAFRRALEQGATHALGASLQLEPALVAGLQQRALHPGNLDDARLAALVREGFVSDARARELGLGANLFVWTGGDPKTISAIRAAAAAAVGRPMTHLRDLVSLRRTDYVTLLASAGTAPATIAAKAERMARTIEAAFPREALEARYRPVKAADLAQNPAEMRRLAARHAGLGLEAVMADSTRDTSAKAAEFARRIDLIGTLYRANPKVAFASVDTFGDELELGQIAPEDRALVLEEVRTVQRLMRVTGGSAEQAYALAEAGFHDSLAVATASPARLAKATGFAHEIAAEYRKRAVDLGVRATAAGGAIIDRIHGGIARTPIDNASDEVDEFLHRLPDYSHYFGNQAFCRCRDCASITSPVAYFVDLMEFVSTEILEETYGTARPEGRPLSLYDRRRDLWNGIPLTCASTDTLEPYLVIINEILENYIHAPAGGTRAEIEAAVYRRLYERGPADAQTPSGFKQPFLLPLERVRIYLENVSLTRGEIAEAVLGAENATALAAARLGMALREVALVEAANQEASFLRGVYLHALPESAGGVTAFDVQGLLAAAGLSRRELEQLVATAFVAGTDRIRIVAERRDADSVQPDIERIHGLTRGSLDRLHRFVRLWRHLPWKIGELDLVLSQLGATSALPLAVVAALRAVQERLRISVEEVCALSGPLPVRAIAEGQLSLFARLFDLPTFARTDAERWALHDSNGTFIHPAFRTEGAGDTTRSRLLAGLKIDDESLLALLGPSAATGLELTHANLARLYQLARLAALLGTRVADLLQVLRLGGFDPSVAIADVAELEARLAFVEWWRGSGLTADELTLVTGASSHDVRALVADVVRDVRQRRLLVFSDTVFGFFDGVTEEQSRAIVAANPTAFAPIAPMYRVSGAIDLATEPIVLPPAMPTDREPLLRERLRELTHADASPFDETVFADLVSEDESRAVFAENTRLFVAITTPGELWLAPTFDPSTRLVIPAGIPVTPDAATQYILLRHASNVVRGVASTRLGCAADVFDAIVEAARYDLLAAPTAASLARALQGGAVDAELVAMFAVLERLAVVFRHRAFTPIAIRFVGANASTVFGGLDLRAPTLAALQALTHYRSLITEDIELLHAALLGFVPSSRLFGDAAVTAIAELFEADRSLVATLARSMPMPADAVRALVKLRRCAELARRLGAGADVVMLLARTTTDEYAELARAADALFAASRTRHDTEERWRAAVEPLEDTVRQRRRDALSDFIIRTHAPDQFRTTDDLYHWFLIDTQLEGCARTSRVVAGIASLQLYVQRVLLRLEQTGDGTLRVALDDRSAAQWEWRKSYRLWEANRRVFLFPERYLLHEVRDDKTELFEREEAQILQQDITEQTVLDVYTRYLDGFTEIAGLSIAGAYHDTAEGRDTLHLFGVARTDASRFFYRAIDNVYLSEAPSSLERRGLRWNAWEELPLQIASRKVSPIVVGGRLYVAWVEISTRGKNPFEGYAHTRVLKVASRRIDGTWTAPQRIDIGSYATVSDPLVERGELDDLWGDVLAGTGVGRSNTRAFYAEILKLAQEDSSVLSYGAYSFTSRFASAPIRVPFMGRTVRALFMPKYEGRSYRDGTALHLEAKDDYRLRGEVWERAFPTLHDGTFTIALRSGQRWHAAALDRYRLRLGAGLVERSSTTTERRVYRNSLVSGLVDIGHGVLRNSVTQRAYAEAFELAITQVDDPTRILANAPAASQLVVVNGTLGDGIVDVDGDLFYVYQYPYDTEAHYILKRLGTTLAERLEEKVLAEGVDELLSIEFQATLAEAPLRFEFRGDDLWNDAGKAIAKGTPDFTGPLGVYFREVYFHMPSLIAEHLNSQQQFAAAQRWYHHIFDPTSNEEPDLSIVDPDERERRRRDRVWQYVEFRNRTLQSLREQLADAAALEAYANDPFNPHAIARLRIDAYKRGVFMRYVENLLDWGDQLFARDTMESINEATLLYVMASSLLGPRPAELGDCSEPEEVVRTYDTIVAQMARCPRAPIAAFEHVGSDSRDPTPAPGGGFAIDPDLLGEITPGDLGLDPPHDSMRELIASFGSSLLRQVCVFCVPPNRDLLALWDRVEDRLFKIRNCMNLAGEQRQLALFAPAIDPMLLVRAKAAGLSLQDVLDTTSGNVPPYRFAFLVAKAKEYAASVQSLGVALMGAFERKDAEELAHLRMVHQQNVLAMSRRLREQEIEAAEASGAALDRRRTTITNRRDFFQTLIDAGWSDWEDAQVGLKVGAQTTKLAVPILHAIAAAAAPAPTIAGVAMSTPAENIDRGARVAANIVSAVADLTLIAADLVGTQAAFERREEGWRQQVAIADDELAELEKQIEGQAIRTEMSRRSLALHEQNEQQVEETFELYREKFPNLSAYTWLASTLQGLYREAYQSAYAMARLAERAYRFERGGDNGPLLRGSYWDVSRAGLLAGERLVADLRDLERRYMETHYRGMEVDQAFSVLQLDPEALIALKETGTCEVVVPELYFDLAYPGQYRRRIQSARLTIPCITGPYTNVGATMTLLDSAIRVEPELGADHLVPVPATRSVTIATSTAQNDGGVFRLDFRDERYMPFEGAGAVNSRWRLTLPSNFRPFDYSTINDVILHISYTAEHSPQLATEIQAQLAEAEGTLVHTLSTIPSRRVMSLRQEFSSTFHRILHVPPGDGPGAPLEVSEKHFPLFLQDRPLRLRQAHVILSIDEATLDDVRPIVWPSIDVTFAGTLTTLAFARDHRFGGLPYASFAVPDTPVRLRGTPVPFAFAVRAAGHFAPSTPHPSDPSPLDATKLEDVLLCLEYELARSG